MNQQDSPFQIVSEHVLHTGLRFNLTRVIEKQPDGAELERDVIRHPGAAVVLPVLDDGQVVMVEQHRTAVGRHLLELPAGVLEAGEDPEETARRELEEETGYRAAALSALVTFYPTPGFADEEMHVFLATQLTPGAQNLDQGEYIRTRHLPLDKVHDLILKGEIVDGKTMIAVLYVMLVGLSRSSEDSKS